MRFLILLLVTTTCAMAQKLEEISILERRAIELDRLSRSGLRLRLTLAYLDSSGWTPESITAAANEGARLLGQCGLELGTVELVRFTAPGRFHYFLTPMSRQLAAALQLGKPTIYFVAGTRQRPAFDAEAIGRGNSQNRPELRDSVWITPGTRDLGIAMAHELVHVLMDSGEHSEEADNLMRDETAPGNSRLSVAQCARLREVGTANGLLSPR